MVAPARPKLRPMHIAFVDAYTTNGFNGQQAAVTAGYSRHTARHQAYDLLTRPHIVEEIERRRALTRKAASIEALEVVEELAALARGDITDVVTWNGHGLVYEASRDLPPEVTAAIKEVREIRRIHRSKDGSEDETIDFRVVMHDKIAPLLGLARILGMMPKEGATAGGVHVGDNVQVVMTGPEMLEAVQRVYGLAESTKVDVIEGE